MIKSEIIDGVAILTLMHGKANALDIEFCDAIADRFADLRSSDAKAVVLTGQDGFSPDQARGFAPTPQPYLFGVCAAPSSDPHCTVNPDTVPKAMDVLTPTGVLQSNELDYTIHNPVILQDVVIP